MLLRYFYNLFHNCLIHPLLGLCFLWVPRGLQVLHDYTAAKAWPEQVSTPVKPDSLAVDIGSLQIRSTLNTSPRSGLVFGRTIEVLVNGQKVACRSLDLHVAYDSVVVADLKFFPEV